MVLAVFRGSAICTDCLRANPVEDEYREQLALWEERYLPITRCQYCQQRTQTAQDPQGPDGGCARCLRERASTKASLWEQICATMRTDDRSTLARLGRAYRQTAPHALREGAPQIQQTPD